MKFDALVALENAGWPVLLVNATGTDVVRANAAAVKVFGAVLQGEKPLLQAVWSPENGVTAQEFFKNWELTQTANTALKFRIKGGAVATFQSSICQHMNDEAKLFIVQLLPESERAADGSAATKQKLDCALQLT